jgi:hypothetical protein
MLLVKPQDSWLILSEWSNTHLTVVVSDYLEYLEAKGKLLRWKMDDGVSWTDLSSPLDQEETIRLSKLAFSPDTSDQVSLIIENNGNGVQVTRSESS